MKMMNELEREECFVAHALPYYDYADAVTMRNTLEAMNFFKAPASSRFHCSYEGGLFDHSLNVYTALRDLTRYNSLQWERPESPFIIGMFHDLCKVDDYIKQPDGTYIRNTNSLYSGHGDKSLIYLHNLMVYPTDEELACIRYHMGSFTEKEEWSKYTGAIHQYPNVFWTHAADMIATHIKEERDEQD